MDIYCMDTSSFIEMKDNYPKDIFPKLWENIDKLCKEGRLIAPFEVKKEIDQGDDELREWAKNKKKIFIKPDERQLKIVTEILIDYKFLAKPEKTGPNADPFVIALAIAKSNEQKETLFPNDPNYLNKYIVVTEESKSRTDRIPAVCRNYNIECINLIELLRREGWKF